MKALRTLAFAAAAIAASAGWAGAQEALTTGDVNMRAGPGSRYPVITTVPEDREVFIHGCLADFDWCDVSWRRNRGWIFSDFLEGSYGQSYVPFYEYRRRTNLPVISFGFGYWDRYYRDRPWFDDWDRWGGRRDGNRDRNRNVDRDRNDDDQVRVRNRDRNRDRDQIGDDDRDQAVARDRDRARNRDRERDDGEGENRRDRLDCNGANADPRCSGIDDNRRNRRGNTMDDDGDNMNP